MIGLKGSEHKLERTRFKQKPKFRIARLRSTDMAQAFRFLFEKRKTPAQLERAFLKSCSVHFIMAFLPVAISQTL